MNHTKEPKEYFENIQQIFQQFFSNIDFNYHPEELYEPIRYVLSNTGKQIRPTLVLMAADFFDADLNDALHAATAVEIFHNFTLVHDDIMDNAEIRRGKPSVYKKYGLSSAILVGDTMFARAYEFVTKISEQKLVQGLNLFNQISIQVCEGQQLDLNFEKKQILSLDEYLNMIKLKTAVLIAGCLKLGSLLGNADEKTQELMYDLGYNMGMLFQIQDDIMDLYANETIFGKKIGNDILDAKKTILYVLALEALSGKEKENFIELYHSQNIDPTLKTQEVKNLFARHQVKERAQTWINKFKNQTNLIIDSLPLSTDQKNILIYLLQLIENRKS